MMRPSECDLFYAQKSADENHKPIETVLFVVMSSVRRVQGDDRESPSVKSPQSLIYDPTLAAVLSVRSGVGVLLESLLLKYPIRHTGRSGNN
ncbi:hypothetical protein AVEN_74245-1 [Araneus ventricosus]|uniref:Uncharacterized protein n=1 Tax=Araneus ventricosus TaxID=182803 RepID=A0A4Y2EVA8_ARAVE|nr:hypothetical protein AVEN_74245-1 [Araneus ventricosus]